MEKLETALANLTTLLDRLLKSLAELGEDVASLHGAVGPLGRIAQRLPGGSRPE
jgi:hypothetical protein